MRHSIWKFELDMGDSPSAQIPVGAKIISAQMQGRQLCVWAICDVDEPKVTREFRIYGTGHPFKGGVFINTVQVGALVFHFFEVKS